LERNPVGIACRTSFSWRYPWYDGRFSRPTLSA